MASLHIKTAKYLNLINDSPPEISKHLTNVFKDFINDEINNHPEPYLPELTQFNGSICNFQVNNKIDDWERNFGEFCRNILMGLNKHNIAEILSKFFNN